MRTPSLSNICLALIGAMALSIPAQYYSVRGRQPLNQALKEAALVQRATEHCSTLAQNLRPACRDAFIRGASRVQF